MTSNRVPRRKPSSKRAPRPRGGDRGNAVSRFFDHFAARVTKWTGSPVAFGTALLAVLVWGLSGPAFGYSETWQLVINTGTTIITFLMVFLIQQSQNKDSEALHPKLDELLIALHGADEGLVDAERLDEDKLLALAAACTARARSQRRQRARDPDEAGRHGSARRLLDRSRRPRSRPARQPDRSQQ
ncbi:low affinity iron permease family protein [Achromobacter dolens]|uniref:low affinity iron permease family protein n=1 Tax=Achromobacter dolens TaxID=1287738 RepID=UPI0006C2E106|nr:low affinity iron permease family protein [Achromobacter dolens]CUJ49566.1 Predicted small integral membrane protein [Achromobacter dolens]